MGLALETGVWAKQEQEEEVGRELGGGTWEQSAGLLAVWLKAHAFLLQQQPHLCRRSPEPGPGPAGQPDIENSCGECKACLCPSTDPSHTMAPHPSGYKCMGSGAQMGEWAPGFLLRLLLPLVIHSPISGLAHDLLQTPSPHPSLPGHHQPLGHPSCSAHWSHALLKMARATRLPFTFPLLFLWPCWEEEPAQVC